MQFLKVRIAQNQPVIGVPQHEGFRDGLDGVAQPQVGGDGAFDEILLLGDVDGDADQMQAVFAVLARQFAARAQPQPASVGVAHAEGMIDRLHLGVGELGGELIEIDVVMMDQRIDLAEGEQIVLRRQAEEVEHRMRPEHPAAREIPVPKAAAAAIERGVDAAPAPYHG